MRTKRQRQNGFILYAVSWMLLLITALIVSGSLLLQKERNLFLALKQQLIDEVELESNVEVLKFFLMNPEKPLFWNIHGDFFDAELSGQPFVLKVQPEDGKLDINFADAKLLQSYFEFVLTDTELANVLTAQILDWRDSDDMSSPEGAEKNEYLAQKRINLPSNTLFRSIDELRYILNMNDEILQKIRPWLTVYSKKSTIDTSFASSYMLSMLKYHNQKQSIENQPIAQELQKREQAAYNRAKYLKDGSLLTLSSIIKQDKGKPLTLNVLVQNNGLVNQKLPIIEWNYQ